MDDDALGQAAWPKDAWRLRLNLDVSCPRLPAVQYGFFSEEPIATFRVIVSRMESAWRAQLNEIDSDEKRQVVSELQLAWAWKHLFHSVQGDQVYLLISSCDEIALMSNALAGKKWLVSMPVWIGDRQCCWSLPFEAVAGQEVQLKLTEQKALGLVSLQPGPQT